MFRHRVARNRFLYLIFLVLVLSGFAYLVTNFTLELFHLILLAIVAIIPGRLVRYFWKDYFAGKKDFQRKRINEAIVRFEQFSARVAESPWIKWLMFFTYGLYSFNIEAVTLTYLGLCRVHQKKFDAATELFRRSLQMDSQYAHGHAGLAIIHLTHGDNETARQQFDLARRCGYPRMTFEEFSATVRREYLS